MAGGSLDHRGLDGGELVTGGSPRIVEPGVVIWSIFEADCRWPCPYCQRTISPGEPVARIARFDPGPPPRWLDLCGRGLGACALCVCRAMALGAKLRTA